MLLSIWKNNPSFSTNHLARVLSLDFLNYNSMYVCIYVQEILVK